MCLLYVAERVKVVVRVRPPHANETGGAVSVAPDNKGIVLYRECAPNSTNSSIFRDFCLLNIPCPCPHCHSDPEPCLCVALAVSQSSHSQALNLTR